MMLGWGKAFTKCADEPRTMLAVEPKNGPHPCGFLEVDDELVIGGVNVVTEDGPAP